MPTSLKVPSVWCDPHLVALTETQSNISWSGWLLSTYPDLIVWEQLINFAVLKETGKSLWHVPGWRTVCHLLSYRKLTSYTGAQERQESLDLWMHHMGIKHLFLKESLVLSSRTSSISQINVQFNSNDIICF